MLSMARNYLDPSGPIALWEELGTGAPTLVAFARLCSAALAANQGAPVEELTEEARAILYAARNRGAIEIIGIISAVDSSERFLAVCIELDAERTIILKRRNAPEQTVRFLDGFRQLCASGLVMHHIFRDFSLTRAGFQLARTIQPHEVPLLQILADEQLLESF
jgi:triphosphoribosyl-dephospho-CoA synthetase